ncbi:MAG: hypothetical protein KDD62_14160, partial [Bdellovibrionales bacterium]|nr:hypothetical protein [Bdellovibrionales bacterium]
MSLFFSPLQVSPELMELSGLSISSRHNILTNQIGEAYHFARTGNSSGTFCSLRIYSDDTTQKGIDFFVVEEETGQRLVIEAFDSAKPYFGVFGSSDEPLQLTPSIELGSCMSGDKIHAAVARVLDHFHYFGFENTLEYFTTLPLVFVEASELRETSLQSVIRHRLLSANQNIHLIECHIDETGAGSLDASLEVRLPASLSIFPIIETLENWRDFRGEHPTRLSLEYLMYTDTTHRITKLDYSSIAENVCVSLCAHDRRKLQDPAVSMLSDIETFVAYRRGFQPIAWAVCDERSYVERMYLLLKGNGEGRLFAMDKVGEV